MTTKTDAEIELLAGLGVALAGLPLDAQYRALAYLVARTMNVGADPISDALYVKAQEARAASLKEGTE